MVTLKLLPDLDGSKYCGKYSRIQCEDENGNTWIALMTEDEFNLENMKNHLLLKYKITGKEINDLCNLQNEVSRAKYELDLF